MHATHALRSFGLIPALILMASPLAADSDELFDHELRRLHSSEVVNLRESFAGHPLLIINTASHCGFTGQFAGLEELHQQYRDAGLKVVGFPSNDFRQEASDEAATADVCFVNYGVTFDMFSPIHVRGSEAHPIFRELARQSQAPRWNFYKYLVNTEGEVVDVFSSIVSPDSRRLRAAIESLLETETGG
jgi:glutathione peroxidase